MFGSSISGLPSSALAGVGIANPALIAGTLSAGQGLFNSYLNYRNYQLQAENYDYQRGLQNTIFGREDNSIQRRVADLRAAGLSPVLAAGQGAQAGQTVSTHAPQIGQMSLGAIEMMNMLKMSADISKTITETAYIDQQSKKIEPLIKLLEAQTSTTKAVGGQKWLDYRIQKGTGTTSNNSGTAGLLKDITGALGTILEQKNKVKVNQKENKPRTQTDSNDWWRRRNN